MALKNYQYNKILRDYDNRQLEAKYELDIRTEEAYNKIPALREIDNEIVTCAIESARQLLTGNEDALDTLKLLARGAEKRRSVLLKAGGYPEDFLKLRSWCPDCKDTGFIGSEKCHCFKQAIVDILYSQSNMKEAIRQENFKTFSYEYYAGDYIEPSLNMTPRENIERVVKECRQFIDTFEAEKGNLLLYGNTGVGKTFLANCIARELLDKAFTVIYLTAFQLFDILEKNKFGRGEDNYESQNQFEYILDCDLLIVDDLGTELNNSFVNVQLYLCINERLLRNKSTIISTNLSLDNINSLYSERVFSRIASNFTLLKVIGEDIRLKKLF